MFMGTNKIEQHLFSSLDEQVKILAENKHGNEQS